MRLDRDLGVSQKYAWYLAHRIRESWRDFRPRFAAPVETDETHVGGLEKNKHVAKKFKVVGGPGKAIVASVRDRATGQVPAARESRN